METEYAGTSSTEKAKEEEINSVVDNIKLLIE